MANRPRDFGARYGGEEFVIVLPETDANGAETIANKCRDVVANAGITHDASTIGRVTLSAGVGSSVPTTHDAPVEFLTAVDQCLYQAKANGRNSVVVKR